MLMLIVVDCMFCEDEAVQEKLRGIVYSANSEDGLRDDGWAWSEGKKVRLR